MKRIALICLALLIALGTLGVGYALWWDEVTIVGNVYTGSVDIEIMSVSETYIYKDLTTRELVRSRVPMTDPNLLYVASATATDVTVDDAERVVMDFDNIFPTEGPIYADVVLHYTGSVPAHVVYTEDFYGDDLSPYLIQQWFIWDDIEQDWIPTLMEDIQLHYCDLLMLWVYLDPAALQRAGKDAQGLSGSFVKTIFVHQWNESPMS